jgi:hypothetical protein
MSSKKKLERQAQAVVDSDANLSRPPEDRLRRIVVQLCRPAHLVIRRDYAASSLRIEWDRNGGHGTLTVCLATKVKPDEVRDAVFSTMSVVWTNVGFSKMKVLGRIVVSRFMDWGATDVCELATGLHFEAFIRECGGIGTYDYRPDETFADWTTLYDGVDRIHQRALRAHYAVRGEVRQFAKGARPDALCALMPSRDDAPSVCLSSGVVLWFSIRSSPQPRAPSLWAVRLLEEHGELCGWTPSHYSVYNHYLWYPAVRLRARAVLACTVLARTGSVALVNLQWYQALPISNDDRRRSVLTVDWSLRDRDASFTRALIKKHGISIGGMEL